LDDETAVVMRTAEADAGEERRRGVDAQLRAGMIDRNADLLKRGLVFGVSQTAAIAGIVSVLR